jgi:hypothetical protein
MVIRHIFVAHHVSFPAQFESTQSIIESKVMVEILINVRAGIQIRIGLWIIPGFFTFGQLLVDLEVLIWLNSRFLNSNQFINN